MIRRCSACCSTASPTAACCSSSPRPVGDDGPDELRQPRARRFAMVGGYVVRRAMSALGVPFLAALPVAFVAAALVGAVLERMLYRRLYRREPPRPGAVLDRPRVHVDRGGDLFLRAVAAAGAAAGFPARAGAQCSGVDLGAYRLFLDRAWSSCSPSALHLLARRARASARRCAPRSTTRTPRRGLGINVDRVFSVTFALGSGLAGLGGALGIDVLGLDPTFPLKYMVYFLLVVAVGGAGTIKGALVAALILGVVRRGGQVLRAADRRLRHLRADGGAADPVPGRACMVAGLSRERVDSRRRARCRTSAGSRSRSRSGCCRSRRSSCCPTTACSAARS